MKIFFKLSKDLISLQEQRYLGTRGIEEAYRTGRGKIRVRAVTNIEPMQNGKNRIIVTELPLYGK